MHHWISDAQPLSSGSLDGVNTVGAGLVDLDASMIVMFALFTVLYFILNKRVFQPMLDMFDKRHDLTAGARDAAELAVSQAEGRIAEYETKVGEARRNAIAETKRMRAEGLARASEVMAEVRKEEDAQLAAAVADLQSQAAAANDELERTASDMGTRIAGRVLGGVA